MFRGITLVPDGTRVPFIPVRKIFYAISLVLIVASVTTYLVRGLNLGIDFQGGIMLEVRTEGPADLNEMRATLNGLGLGDVSLQEFGQANDVLIRVQKQDGGEEAQQQAVSSIKDALGDKVEYRRTEVVGPKISEELFTDGIIAVSLAIGAILIYIWFRFEWQFGLGAVIALTHDILTTVGLFALLQLEFNLSTVAAMLTIAGYSINDTVVVFDRVRENLRRYKSLPIPELLNQSINETLSRTIMTSVTTLVALGSLYILGGEVIRGFSLAMIWGVIIGTYSSVCLAVPLLMFMNIRSEDVALDTDEATEGSGG